MKRLKVDSSMISSLGHDARTSILEIEFNTGAIWQYHEVPRRVFTELKKCDSVGRYFRENVQGMYHEIKIRR